MRIPLQRLAPALPIIVLGVLVPGPAGGQQAPARPNVAPSGRVTTSVAFDGRLLLTGRDEWGWFTNTPSHSGPSRMIIDYGQPHARGREVFGSLVPYGEVWRLGANWATTLMLDVEIVIGDLELPRGEYTLWLVPREDGAELVVSEETRQWGTDYDGSRDFGRTSMARRDLTDHVESLAITLQPYLPEEDDAPPSGTLRITWGLVEYSTGWRMPWPEKL